MTLNEQSFPDRLARATLLKEACATMTPAFTPAGADLTIAAQTTLLVTLTNCCTNVNNAVNDLKEKTDERATVVKDIKARVTRALGRVKSNLVWAPKLPLVKAAADSLRAARVTKTTPLPPPTNPDAPAPAPRNRGGQSYKDIEGHFQKFNNALTKCTGYDTGAPPDIFSGALTNLHTAYKTLNDVIPQKETDLTEVRLDRLRRFSGKLPLPDGTTSLRDRFIRIKTAVGSQYGRTSDQFLSVKNIKF